MIGGGLIGLGFNPTLESKYKALREGKFCQRLVSIATFRPRLPHAALLVSCMCGKGESSHLRSVRLDLPPNFRGRAHHICQHSNSSALLIAIPLLRESSLKRKVFRLHF